LLYFGGGCGSSNVATATNNGFDIDNAKQISTMSNGYTSLVLDDNSILVSGKNGMSLTSQNKELRSYKPFKIPTFGKKTYRNSDNELDDFNMTYNDIYTMHKNNSSIFVGGLFNYVNGEHFNNIVNRLVS